MYRITIYDYLEDGEWTFMDGIEHLHEAKELKYSLDISFKMLDVRDRVGIRIQDRNNNIIS